MSNGRFVFVDHRKETARNGGSRLASVIFYRLSVVRHVVGRATTTTPSHGTRSHSIELVFVSAPDRKERKRTSQEIKCLPDDLRKASSRFFSLFSFFFSSKEEKSRKISRPCNRATRKITTRNNRNGRRAASWYRNQLKNTQ